VPGETVGGALWNQRRGVIAYADATAPSEAETAAGVLARIRDRLIEKGVSC
jgi:formylmethanofuran dehydrogenase subunit B